MPPSYLQCLTQYIYCACEMLLMLLLCTFATSNDQCLKAKHTAQRYITGTCVFICMYGHVFLCMRSQ